MIITSIIVIENPEISPARDNCCHLSGDIPVPHQLVGPCTPPASPYSVPSPQKKKKKNQRKADLPEVRASFLGRGVRGGRAIRNSAVAPNDSLLGEAPIPPTSSGNATETSSLHTGYFCELLFAFYIIIPYGCIAYFLCCGGCRILKLIPC